MTTQNKDRIECAIRHIESSLDVDPWAVEIAVEAMKAQLSAEGTTSDLISRQEAIDAECEVCQIAPKKERGHNCTYYVHGCKEIECLRALPSAQPEMNMDEWCTDCKEYDHEKHCCPRWNRVIRQTLKDAQPEPQWIPVKERLPEELETVIITWKNHKPESYYSDIKDKPLTGVGIYHREKWWWWSAYAEDMLAEYGDSKADRMDEAIEVTAWMPLPEPYRAERITDGRN